MTPSIEILKKSRVSYRIHHYQHDDSNSAFGLEAAEKLGISPLQVFKTLVLQLDNRQLAVGVIPVSEKLSMKLFARACGAKKAAMADSVEVQRSTGYVLGGVSPLGQKKRLQTVIHVSARNFQTIFVSAGRRGLEIELSPNDLKTLTDGLLAEIAQVS